MGEVSERDIISFTYELVNEICKINEDLILEGCSFHPYFMHFGKKKLYLFNIIDGLTEEEALRYLEPEEEDVREFAEEESIAAMLACEGTLFEKVYYRDYWEGDEEADKLEHTIYQLAGKHGLVFGYDRIGFLNFYDPGR